MPRDSRVYLEDILAAAAKIRSYVGSMTADEFEARIQALVAKLGV